MRALQLLVVFFFAVGVAAAAPLPGFLLEPTPAWVDPSGIAATETISDSRISHGTEYVLRDDQIRLDEPLEHYSRRVVRIVSTAGLQNWQEIGIDFDPSFQALVLHHARILRDGVSIDALRPDEIRTIQRETDLAERIYDGRMTALLFLHDLRPGDVIDYAWSLRGSNPILKGKFVDTALLALSEPARRIRWRLLHEPERQISTRIHRSDAKVSERRLAGGWIEKRVELAGVEPLVLEESLPSWFDPWPQIEASEFEDWKAVSGWAGTLFDEALPDTPDQAVAQTLAMIRGRADSDHDRALSAIRFVQDEIRYLGIEAGPHSHRPHAPATVLARRFGDCKDKALLLTELLRGLGFESAHVALVDSGGGRELPNRLPSPFAFNHAIAVFEYDGRQIWVDATLSGVGGTLESMATPLLDRALVVAPATSRLATVGSRGAEGLTRVIERWTLEQDGARFQVESIYSGRDADALRSMLSTTSLVDLGRQYRDYYARTDPDIEPDGLPEISDDRTKNLVVVRENYVVPDFWADASEREFWAHIIGSRLATPPSVRRHQPFAIGSAGRLEHEIEIIGGTTLQVPLAEKNIDNPAFRLQTRSWRERDRIRFRCVWESRRDTVAPSQLAEYATALWEAEDALSMTVATGGMSLAGMGFTAAPALPAILAGSAAAAVGVVGLTGLAVSRRRRTSDSRWRGSRVRSVADIAALPESIHCGRPGVPVPAAARTISSEPGSGAPIVSMAVVCPECLRTRVITAVIELGARRENSAPPET